MDWARDYLGNLVPATSSSLTIFSLVCPTCGEPVRRRAGPERRPHFAHFSFRAKPECENFFPSLDAVRRSFSGRDKGDIDQVLGNQSDFGIFLGSGSTKGSHTLYLRLPLLQAASELSGQLEVVTAQGSRTYRSNHLTMRRLIPLMPNAPVGKASGDGDLAALAAAINRELSNFDPSLNVFHGSISSSRNIGTGEQLEWGGTYRLLARDNRDPPTEIGELLHWRKCGSISSWFVYEARLPKRLLASKAHLRGEISLFLRRKIGTPRPSIALVNPLPHHFDPDGAFVYPAFPASILIRRSENLVITVNGLRQGHQGISVVEHCEAYVSIKLSDPHFHELAIAVGESRPILLRLDDCKLFQPRGLVASASDAIWNLLELSPISDSEMFGSVARIECGNERLANYLSKLNPSWTRNKFIFAASEGCEKVFHGEALGRLDPLRKAQTSNAAGHVRLGLNATATGRAWWLQSVIVREFGPHVYMNARLYLSEPSNETLQLLGPLLYSPWMPYLRAAACPTSDR